MPRELRAVILLPPNLKDDPGILEIMVPLALEALAKRAEDIRDLEFEGFVDGGYHDPETGEWIEITRANFKARGKPKEDELG